VAVLAEGFGTFFRVGSVFFGCFVEGFYFLGSWVFGPERADEFNAFLGYDADGFCAAVQEDFRHGWFVGVLHAAVETVIGGLKRHLNERVRGETRGGHEVFAVVGELERLEFVLLD